MDRIETMGLNDETNFEDGPLTKVCLDIVKIRNEILALEDPEIEMPFPGLSNEMLIQRLEESLERDQQEHPLTYDVALGFRKDLSQSEALSKLARYESTLDRSLYRALHELQRLQALRKGASSGPPAAVDVDVSVSGK
jgi:DNA-binding MltR family transcriptional regulator